MLELDYTRYKRLMVMAPHPDDLEGFAGGLVFKTPSDVISVVFAGGNLGVWEREFSELTPEEYIHIRLEESEEAAQILGVRDIIYMGYKDREVVCDEEAIDRALSQIRQYEPDALVSFEYLRRATLYGHPDHMATANIVRRAVARYEKNDQLDYYLCSTLLPNRFLDISGCRLIKLEALACHSTQVDLNAVIFPFFEKAMSRLWGAYKGVQYAEGYRLVNIPKMRKKLDKEQAFSG